MDEEWSKRNSGHREDGPDTRFGASGQARIADLEAQLLAMTEKHTRTLEHKKKWLQKIKALQSELGAESTARGDIERLLAQAQAETDQAMAEAEQAEAERLREQQERMRLQAERDLLLGGSATMLSMQVDALLQGSWAKRSTYTFSRLLDVTEVTDPDLKARFEAYTQRLTAEMGGEGSPEWDVTQLLFHG